MSAPRKAEWALAYDDGSEKIVVTYDLTSERHPRARMTRDQVREIRRRHDAGESTYSIADAYGLHSSYVAQICRGERWANA